MALVIPTPRDVLGVARATTSWAFDAVVFVAVLPVRVAAVLTDVEQVVARIADVVAEAAVAVAEVRRTVEGAAGAIAAAERTVAGAAGAIAVAERTVAGAAGVIAVAERTVEGAAVVIAEAASAVERSGRAVDGAERTVAAAAGVIAVAGSTVERSGRAVDGAERTVAGAEQAISRADTTVSDAARVIVEAMQATHAAMALLDTWRPIAEQAAPLAGRFVQELSAEELHAAIRAIDQLPALTAHLQNEVMPLLATLDRAGPDVHELLDVVKDVRETIAAIPGFTFLRKRGENRIV